MPTQTEQFMALADNEKNKYIKTVAGIMKKYVEQISTPSSEDIEKVLVDIAAHLPNEKTLLTACNEPNWRCGSCPFGVYLHKSGKLIGDRPTCLVWISFAKKNLPLRGTGSMQKDIKVN